MGVFKYNPGIYPDKLFFVSNIDDLPSSVDGVITLEDNTNYFITTTIDLTGNRIISGRNTCILGGTSENSILTSTGLNVATPLITSQYSLPMRNISITSGTALDLNATEPNQALDWGGVNFLNCPTIGAIKGFTNLILTDCAFLNSANMIFDGELGSAAFNSCLFDGRPEQSIFDIKSTAVFTRRFRIIFSAFICLPGETAISFNPSATIPVEAYILDTCSFSGDGTYLAGITQTSNNALFTKCTGINNTAVNGQLYMQNSTTTTIIGNTTNFFKVAGTTIASPDNSKYTATNNRLTCGAVVSRKYLVQATVSITGSPNNEIIIGFFDSTLDEVREPSQTRISLDAGGKFQAVPLMCVIDHVIGDYIEVHVRNLTSSNNVTVTNLNLTVTQL